MVADRLCDPAQQFQHAIVGFVIRERFHDPSGILKMIGGVCHGATMPYRSPIGNARRWHVGAGRAGEIERARPADYARGARDPLRGRAPRA